MADPCDADDPVRDCLRAGYAALMRGDTAERDRQVERARRIMAAQQAKPSTDASRGEIVARLIRTMEREFGRPLTAQERNAITTDPATTMHRMLDANIRLSP
ncbi:MAG: hypothetical protein ACRYHQ_16135 [Janthinobacterium lividum]